MIVSQPDRVLLRRELEAFAPHLSGVILDIGGGTGKRYRGFFPHATSIRALDINPDLKPDIVGDAEAMPIPDASIDGVVCSQMLEHVPHPSRALAEMYRVLKPGGKAILTVPQLNELHEEPHDYYRYTKHGLKTLCEEAGFRIVELKQRGKYHGVMAQNRIRRWIDHLRPYERAWAMLLLGPVTLLYTKYALWRDKHDHSAASAKHAIGWSLLLEKPSN
ncbi:MAG: type 11 methyltransferase [Candidatus Peregrinibacteria bacterium Greene0416_19]|nr:MAG: type 11 methyltransferase [Candidatus Peregrinibacteria bacterium Greene0416_19]